MHESKILAKIHHDAIGGNLLGDMGEFVMPAMQISFNDWMTSMGWPAIDKPSVWNVAISNLSGPDSPLYLSGHRLAAHYPVGMVMDGQALMITVARYRDKIGFGLVADRHVVPDLLEMVAGLPVALDQLEQASRIAAA
jgi:hypothetical protein